MSVTDKLREEASFETRTQERWLIPNQGSIEG